MKCDLKKMVKAEDGTDTFVPCSRPRNMILNTRFGRLGVCAPCRDFVKAAELEYKDLQKKAKGKPLGKSVKLDNKTEGRAAPELMIWQRFGHIVCSELPKSA